MSESEVLAYLFKNPFCGLASCYYETSLVLDKTSVTATSVLVAQTRSQIISTAFYN